MKFEQAIKFCNSDEFIYRDKGKDTRYYPKNHPFSLKVRVPLSEQIFTDWKISS